MQEIKHIYIHTHACTHTHIIQTVLYVSVSIGLFFALDAATVGVGMTVP
jgi:hypothetical protein